jgi:hypothetical protein
MEPGVHAYGAKQDSPPVDPTRANSWKGEIMFSWAIVFLVIALIAALFGFSGLAGRR